MEATLTAVIPTGGTRGSLVRAVASALAQVEVEVEVLVVGTQEALSAAESLLAVEGLKDRVTMANVPDGAGAGTGRNHGTNLARSEFVAYLDDDDYWAPRKSIEQISSLRADKAIELLSCQAHVFSASNDSQRAVVVPSQVFDHASGPVGDYLFRNRQLRVQRNLVHTSTLMARADSARACNWDPGLRRHQDWDFVIRFCDRYGQRSLKQLELPLLWIETGRGNSVSSGDEWRVSLEWLESVESLLSDRAASDLLVGQVGRYALQARDYNGVLSCVRRAKSLGIPSPSAVALLGAGLLNRSDYENLALVLGRIRSKTT